MRVVLSNASNRWGGVHTVTELLARGLLERGHQVHLLARAGSALERRMRAIVPVQAVLGATDLGPRTVARSLAALRRLRPDVLLALTKKDVRQAVQAAHLARVPVVIRHPNDQPLPGGLRGRLLYRAATHVTNAQATRATLLASASWLRPESVEVIYNGIDADRWEGADPEPLELAPDAVALGYIGAWEPRKGLLTLAEAWHRAAPRIPQAHLLLAGAGSQEAELRAALDGAPRVHWLGYRKLVPRLMRALDVLVLPSYTEGAPNVVLEAMAAGRAVVATAVSGTPELMRHGVEGRLVPARDPAALADALVALASDPAQRESMGRAGAQRARTSFSLRAMLDGWEELLRRASGTHRKL
jgi:glycosyltransferase involved in cell wall biosynthesis